MPILRCQFGYRVIGLIEYANISTLQKQQLYNLEVPTMRRGVQ